MRHVLALGECGSSSGSITRFARIVACGELSAEDALVGLAGVSGEGGAAGVRREEGSGVDADKAPSTADRPKASQARAVEPAVQAQS